MLLFIASLWTAATLVGADNQTDQSRPYYPNCDLVSISYVGVDRNENGTLDIWLAWDRRGESYAKLDGPITKYVIRHGPLISGKPANVTFYGTAPAEEDRVVVQNVIPSDNYFISFCAVENTFALLNQDDLWDHAWIGVLGLSDYKMDTETPTPVPDNQTDQTRPYYPNCDLVSISYVGIDRNENGTLDISLAWDRREESYAKLEGPITKYVIRHGALVNGKPANVTFYETAPADKNEVVVRNVIPSDNYFISFCAVENTFPLLNQDDLWDHAWIGGLGLRGYKMEADTPTPVPEQPTSFVPSCDLVQTSYVSIFGDKDTKALKVFFSWDKKESSYKQIGTFDHYLVRHGPANGDKIIAGAARLMVVQNDKDSFVLTDVQPGTKYGLQVCAVRSDVGIDAENMKWDSDAWCGTLDLYGSYKEYGWEVDNDANTTEPAYDPACDLMQTTSINFDAADRNTKTMTVVISWIKKSASYEAIGPFGYYLVRFEPYERNDSAADTDSKFFMVDRDATNFSIPGISFGNYGVSMCAGPDFGINWAKAARVGPIPVTPLIFEAKVYEREQQDMQADGDQGNQTANDFARDDLGIFARPIGLNLNYGIILIILSVITIILITLAAIWLLLTRRRRQQKLLP